MSGDNALIWASRPSCRLRHTSRAICSARRYEVCERVWNAQINNARPLALVPRSPTRLHTLCFVLPRYHYILTTGSSCRVSCSTRTHTLTRTRTHSHTQAHVYAFTCTGTRNRLRASYLPLSAPLIPHCVLAGNTTDSTLAGPSTRRRADAQAAHLREYRT